MNDKIVINTISKIYFIIISFLSFIFLTLSIVFILLQNGIYIDDLSVPNLKIKKLYIKWNKNINVTVDEINIIKESSSKSKSINYKEINEYFKKIVLFNNWFEQIIVNKITFNEISASFKYIKNKNGFLNIYSKDFSLKSSLFFESKLFNIKIDEFHDHKRKISVNGNIIFDAYSLELTSSLNTTINNEIFLNILFNATRDKLFYKINSLKDIKSVTYAIDLFNLDSRVRYWIVDAINASTISLTSAYGWLDYKHINEAYKNIYASAILKKLNYTYDQKLDAIHTVDTAVEFKDGVLNIRPHDAYTYGFFLDKSWLKIDFTTKEELLTLYLMFKGIVNNDLLYLLNRYDIKLPILQNSGTVDTNLKLTVNLRTIDVEAHGDFFSKKANFRYLGLDIDVTDAYITLDNFNVGIKDMLSKYKTIATAKVNVEFDAKNKKGVIDFKVDDINFKELGISLKKQDKPLNVSYHISPIQDTIEIDNSVWNFYNQTIKVAKVNVPFDLDTLRAKIPATLTKIDKTTSAYISGTASFKPNNIDLNIGLLNFSYNNIKMAQSNAELTLSYANENIKIESADKILFNIENFNPVLSNISIDIKDKKVFFNNIDLALEDIANTKIKGFYNANTNKGSINLVNLDIQDKEIKKIIKNQNNLNILIDKNKRKTTLTFKDLDLSYIHNNKGWILKSNSIKKLAKHSDILNQYSINNGDFILSKNTNDKDIKFTANIDYPYKILIKNNKPVEKYNIVGKIENKTNNIYLNINNSVDVAIKKEIEIKADNIGININDILKYFNDQTTTSDSTKKKDIFLNLTNSHLWISKNRHVISDTIDLQYFNNITTAQLAHKEGKAGFKFDNNLFHLYGEGFNDDFMDNLFALSKFQGGKLSFSMNGTTSEYDGIFYIHNTVILDYKILNNILAFINTVPSLVTFSLPGYNKNGLAVRSAYADFHSKDNTIKFKNIYLDSKEMDIAGRGNLSFKRNEIDLILNLKSDLGSRVNKIPVVGYILLGDDTISTSLSITGKLDNPNIKSLIAKDIIVAPVNIIKRALYAPFNLFKKK